MTRESRLEWRSRGLTSVSSGRAGQVRRLKREHPSANTQGRSVEPGVSLVADGARLLIVGTHHFDSKADAVNFNADDVLSPRRQNEIRELVQRLKQFNPTKVAIEARAEDGEEYAAQYRAYLDGEYEHERNEIYQVGFRLAKTLGHPQTYAIDWNERAIGLDTDVEAFAKQNDQSDLLEEVLNIARLQMERLEHIQASGSLIDLYRFTNDPETIRESHRLYYKLARIGSTTHHPGANYVQHWYGRNLKIYINLTRLVRSHDERILLIIGGGHVWFLKQFAEEDGFFTLEDPWPYLEGE